MRVLLMPVGSAGDVHPFVALGLELRHRGHEVTVITGGHFADLAARAGLGFAEGAPAEVYEKAIRDPDLWHPDRGFAAVCRFIVPALEHAFEVIRDHYEPGSTVVVGSGLAFPARLAHDALGVPLATVHLQPACFWSSYSTPLLHPGLAFPWPRAVRRLLRRLVDTRTDRTMAPAINALRARLRLPPIRRVVFDWWHSPQRVIGLFPSWFAPPQLDWPPQTVLTGFPLYDEADLAEPTAELDAFLAEGSAPVVFAPGSSNIQAIRFFEAALGACRMTGRRGLLLTRYAAQVPPALPPGVRHFPYVPFSRLLPHAAALVCHGGIGTLAQGLAAGVPHVVVPMSHDQPDNGARIARIGVGTVIRSARLTAARLARALDTVVASQDVAARCADLAQRLGAERPIGRTCDEIEALGGRDVGR